MTRENGDAPVEPLVIQSNAKKLPDHRTYPVLPGGGGGKEMPAFPERRRMPVIFIGHGSPENALGNNPFSTAWKQLGKMISKPELILSISAHWIIQEGTAVTATRHPRTIHDFYGFPDELYRIEYPAPGSPEGAKIVQNLIHSSSISLDYEWGLDHGTWSVLRHMYPEADIPVIQLSLNYNQPLSLLFRIGEELSPLRERGVLILGSGNLVHNLMMLSMHEKPYPWALEFDNIVKNNLTARDYDSLIDYTKYPVSSLAHPTSEHFLPLLCIIGAVGDDLLLFFNEIIFAGSISMRCAVFGLDTG